MGAKYHAAGGDPGRPLDPGQSSSYCWTALLHATCIYAGALITVGGQVQDGGGGGVVGG